MASDGTKCVAFHAGKMAAIFAAITIMIVNVTYIIAGKKGYNMEVAPKLSRLVDIAVKSIPSVP